MKGTNARRGDQFLDVIDASARTKRGIRQKEGESTRIFNAAESGDLPTTRTLLINDARLVKAHDELGRTALELAVNSSQNDIVVELLNYYTYFDWKEIKNALKEAIRLDNESTAEAIIRHEKYKQIYEETTKKKKKPEDEDERWDALEMSPIEMAAQMEHFGIVQLLLMKGQSIAVPHEYSCMCEPCRKKYDTDPYQLAKSRLETYKALASEAYVSLAAKDPIDEAFKLGKKLRELANLEKHFRSQYLQLADNLSDYVAKLLDQVNTDRQLQFILNESGDSHDNDDVPLKRLEKAIDLGEKKFVSHPSVVKKLVNVWYDDLRRFEDSPYLLLLISALWVIAYPLMSVFYWFAPKTEFARLMRIPYLKFLGYVCMVLYFTIVLLVHVYLDMGTNDFGSSEVEKHVHRYFPGQKGLRNSNAIRSGKLPLYIMICIFICGMVWQEIKQLYDKGFTEYTNDAYNMIDWVMHNLYISSLTLYFLQLQMTVSFGRRVLDPSDTLYKAYNDTQHPERSLAVSCWYWNIPDRHMWEAYDPLIISEGLFSFANILAIVRLTYFMRVSELLGPMQISLGKIISDVARFMALFLLIFVAFMVGLQNLYRYYSEDHRKAVERSKPVTGEDGVKAMDGFGTFEKSMHTLFWSLFGMVDPDVGSVMDGDDGYGHHSFTEYVGYIIFGLYNVVMIIILLNMFIAMMTQSYETVSGSSDVEWKFARARLYMDFVSPGSTLAFPFNMIISFKSIYYMGSGKYCGWKNCKKPDELDIEMAAVEASQDRRGSNMSTTGFLQKPGGHGGVLEDKDETSYQKVIWNLIKRYILQREMEADIAEGEMDEIKNDIGSLRYQLLNQLNDQMARANEGQAMLSKVNGNVAGIERRMGAVETDLGTIKDRLNDINVILGKVAGGGVPSVPTGKPSVPSTTSGPSLGSALSMGGVAKAALAAVKIKPPEQPTAIQEVAEPEASTATEKQEESPKAEGSQKEPAATDKKKAAKETKKPRAKGKKK